ncbi:DUF4254 domain-containing protein [Nocardia panacis]|uniref:DUF4254 domain-containing protein n=1 Tax=Nocardia panacis TaxID=2340916 RepID=A0A3A4KV05_9NOCA|nr:DUF4254 domain-containing protein [Nocardia panacis]RJO77206.1 DUF4254 domain-containing protein [Nocardia panacis]
MELPTKEQVLDAVRIAPRGGHPVLDSAYLLAGLHKHRPHAKTVAVVAIDTHRTRIVHDIDRWVAVELPLPPGGAHMHTESVGTVVDRLAEYSVAAHAALYTEPEWAIHAAWDRLAQLAIGYEDLVHEVSAGLRRLPSYEFVY